ncbi:MarR family transcriptional regulator [Selenomonas sp. TAMA-11512]|uniref:MarR family winged helix-turn-helix transcriptional regulator n=1 Tax=Selenomonas sp. TAMA-11512 TaxID=3095337 RepID=UPI0030905BA6|nr:MarR family transcriptional regulator [Selenomonas sp. TAMA-11512]
MATEKEKEEALLLKNQLCFPLYAASRRIVAAYHPFLECIGLTYTQYVTMMVIWERKVISVKELGERLYLDSGTLTPLLKKLEAQGYITRARSKEDERIVIVELTAAGADLKNKAMSIPESMVCRLNEKTAFTKEELNVMRTELYKLIKALS